MLLLSNPLDMPDRRRDKRYTLTEPTYGVVRTLLDAAVHRTAPDEWIALGRQPAVIGEILVLDFAPDDGNADARERCPVYVLDSQPAIVDGVVRHRIRLKRSQRVSVFKPQAAHC